ncbi:ABC-F family ATP-binding cassette domain-containing protein [bacterium]|nr:ABC-F family ATP-binding cassette domain-containing protein [bacterium]
MSLVVFDNVSLNFGQKTILDNASLRIAAHDRIGLVGLNGTGKSTILRLILGKQSVDGGQIVRARGLRMGYLPQEIGELGGGRLLATVLAAAPGREALLTHLAQTEAQLAESTDADEQMELAETLADLHDEITHFETAFAPHAAEKILLGLGFEERDFDRHLAEFSGGWRMRAALAGLLFQKPDLLLLDEPTNHLDVPSLLWFDDFLKNEKQATFVMISHDREFLNRQIDRVVALEIEGVRTYSGNFEQYLVQREEEERILIARVKNQERMIAETERFIRRFRAKSTKARQVQDRVKKLEKIERVEAPISARTLEFSFDPTPRSGRDVIRVAHLSKSFGDLRLFRDLSLTVHRGDRIGIIGRNGAGKTTLLRMMAGELLPDAGQVQPGSNVEAAYYAQHHADQLSGEASILTEVWSIDRSAGQTRVRTICGIFLFSGDDVEKPCGVLSGGEKARVVLAKLMMKPGNLLLMDEPTNHLDLYATEALGEALETYDGTIVFVSHNRAFVNRLATKIWDLDGTGVTEYLGNLDDYQYHLQQRAKAALAGVVADRGMIGERIAKTREAEAAARNARTSSSPATAGGSPKKAAPESEAPRAPETADARKEARREAVRRREEHRKRFGPLEKEVADLEKRIARLEEEQTALSNKLADPEFYADVARSRDASIAYKRNQEKIDELMARWEGKQKQLEEAERLEV